MDPVMMLGWNAEMYDVLTCRGQHVAVFDDKPDKVPEPLLYEGTWADADRILKQQHAWPVRVVIGVASSAQARAKAIDWLHQRTGWSPLDVVSRQAVVSMNAQIGRGAFIADCAYVGPFAYIDDWACVLPGGKVMHDSVIGLGSIVVGNATVLGRAKIGRRCWICAAATVLPDAVIGDDLIVPYRGMAKRGVPDVPPQ